MTADNTTYLAAVAIIHALASATCQIIRAWKQPVTSAAPDKSAPAARPVAAPPQPIPPTGVPKP